MICRQHMVCISAACRVSEVLVGQLGAMYFDPHSNAVGAAAATVNVRYFGEGYVQVPALWDIVSCTGLAKKAGPGHKLMTTILSNFNRFKKIHWKILVNLQLNEY